MWFYQVLLATNQHWFRTGTVQAWCQTDNKLLSKQMMTWTGARFTNGFSIAIQIRWQFRFTLTSILIQWSLQKFCTWHDSCAVVTCAKYCCDLMASNRVMARRGFHRIWIAGKKTLVKRASVSLTLLCFINSSPPEQNGWQFRRQYFQMHFLEWKC